MRNKPTDDYEHKELARLNCQPWQIALLDLNPSYCSWGPYEDYMSKTGGGWDGAQFHDTWKAFGPWGLDDLNELVNFYFRLSRASKDCPACGGSGYHPDARWISESFYGHSTPFRARTSREKQSIAVLAQCGGEMQAPVVTGFPSRDTFLRYGDEFSAFCRRMRDGTGEWHDDITDDEVDALWEAGRLKFDFKNGKPSAAEVNAAQHSRTMGLIGHDGINRCILIEARCKRLGVPKSCEKCDGHGHVFIADSGQAGLVLWFLHPRKGCSRGVEVKRIEQDELPEVFAYLKAAAQRNTERFSKIA